MENENVAEKVTEDNDLKQLLFVYKFIKSVICGLFCGIDALIIPLSFTTLAVYTILSSAIAISGVTPTHYQMCVLTCIMKLIGVCVTWMFASKVVETLRKWKLERNEN